MFLGHFGLAAASKPLAPEVPVGALMVASQAMDVLFLPLVLLGVESIQSSGYGTAEIHADYTHSLVGALLIAAVVYWLGRALWKTSRAGWTLAGLSFSHWLLDLPVHHQDMPLLPGNWGNLPLLGFGLWNYPMLVFGVELLMAVVGLAIYLRWSLQQSGGSRRGYVGPAITALLFLLAILIDHPQPPWV